MQKLDFNILVEKLSGSADLIDPYPRKPTPGNPTSARDKQKQNWTTKTPMAIAAMILCKHSPRIPSILLSFSKCV